MLKNIKLLRNERGISQQKLASEIGMSQQSINGYENNGIEPDISTLTHIADYFQTSVDYIIGRTAIRHIYSEMDEHALTVRELELIQNYRLLPEVSRRIIDELIEDMSDRHIAGYSLT